MSFLYNALRFLLFISYKNLQCQCFPHSNCDSSNAFLFSNRIFPKSKATPRHYYSITRTNNYYHHNTQNKVINSAYQNVLLPIMLQKQKTKLHMNKIHIPHQKVINQQQPIDTIDTIDIRYSDFLKLIKSNRIEKVTFTNDGMKLIAINKDGIKIKLEHLPKDTDLLPMLTSHKVDITVLARNERPYGLFRVMGDHILSPLIFISCLFFLLRNSRSSKDGKSGRGGLFGPGGRLDPFNFGKSKSK